jgi:hypothetical protein
LWLLLLYIVDCFVNLAVSDGGGGGGRSLMYIMYITLRRVEKYSVTFCK